jgi:hypothetical protein
MPRGHAADIGQKTINKNGYECEKTKDGWVGCHILLMERHLGRKLEPGEYVAFLNGHNPPITIDMIELRKRGDRSPRRRLAEIEARIDELVAERDLILEQISE